MSPRAGTDMRSRAARTTGQGSGRDASPYAAPAHLCPGPDGVRVALAGLCDADPSVSWLAASPAVLLTGGPVAGARSTLDAVEAAAGAGARLAVARVRAMPGAPLWPALVQVLDGLVEDLVRGGAASTDAARVRTAVEDLRRPVALDARAGALGSALEAVAAAAAAQGTVPLVIVDDLHAAPRSDSEAVLDALGRVAAANAGFGAIASASHRATVGVDPASRSRWTEVPLRVGTPALTELDAHVGAVHGRSFEPCAIDELVRAGDGNVGLVLAHATAAWESTSGPRISVEQVHGARGRAALATDAELRRSWTGRLSIGQRRCLRAIAEDGGSSDVDDVARRLGGEARFGLSPGMIETVLCSLVQRGLVVVHDGIVEIAVPGLATIL